MFTAKVYKVLVRNAGTILEEERLAREIINRWSLVNGERKGVVFFLMSMESDSIDPDLIFFVADAYVDEYLIDAALAKGVPVLVFSRKVHDAGNSMPGEIEAMEAYRGKIQERCKWVEYVGMEEFERVLMNSIEAFA